MNRQTVAHQLRQLQDLKGMLAENNELVTSGNALIKDSGISLSTELGKGTEEIHAKIFRTSTCAHTRQHLQSRHFKSNYHNS